MATRAGMIGPKRRSVPRRGFCSSNRSGTEPKLMLSLGATLFGRRPRVMDRATCDSDASTDSDAGDASHSRSLRRSPDAAALSPVEVRRVVFCRSTSFG